MRESGISDRASTSLEEIVSGAGTVVLCTPVEVMEPLACEFAPFLSGTACVTDAGSVKGSVVTRLEPLLGGRFVGAHPIAGSERGGFEAARADLYEGAACVVTPTPATDADALESVSEFWKMLGCRIFQMTPDEHDQMLAFTSHLPHVGAAALALAVESAGDAWPDFVGGGFRDSTRIAASNPDLWTGIVMANAAALRSSIAEMRKLLQEFDRAVETGDSATVRAWFAKARDSRTRLNTTEI